MIDSPEVEKEVKRLLRADTFAVNVCILSTKVTRVLWEASVAMCACHSPKWLYC